MKKIVKLKSIFNEILWMAKEIIIVAGVIWIIVTPCAVGIMWYKLMESSMIIKNSFLLFGIASIPVMIYVVRKFIKLNKVIK